MSPQQWDRHKTNADTHGDRDSNPKQRDSKTDALHLNQHAVKYLAIIFFSIGGFVAR